MDLLIIGLDGLSYNMIDKFDIETEFIDSVGENGISGELMSVDTPTTLPAWTSFQTGKDPGSHGLTNMIQQSADYQISPFETNETEPAIYDLIEDAIFVNLPASIGREPAAANTQLVSAMLAKDKADAVPPQLKQLDAYEEYILDHDKSLKKRPSVYFDHVCDITRRRRDFAAEAFETYSPSVGFVLFSTPDWAGHLLSNFSTDSERAKYYRQLLEVVDDCAADLSGLAENVMLMSDHGFEKKKKNIHLNDWLETNGYVTTVDEQVSPQHVAVAAAKAVGKRSDLIYEGIRRVYNYIIGTSVGQSLQDAAESDVDYPASMAWQLRYGCVFINDSRFRNPTVDDPDSLRKELKKKIAAISGPDGSPAFREVLLADEAYENPGDWAPDIIARPAEGCYPTTLDSPTGEPVSQTNNYNHRYRGMIAANGPLFRSGDSINNMSIVDVLPTVLHAIHAPVLSDFDGEVRMEMLAGGHEIEFIDPKDTNQPKLRTATETEKTEREEEVTERLEDLGYLE